MTTLPAAPATQMPAVPASPSQAAAAGTPGPRFANIEPVKITATRVKAARRDIERTVEALDKAIETLAGMAAGKENSENATVQRLVWVVKEIGTAAFRTSLTDSIDAMDDVLSDLAEL